MSHPHISPCNPEEVPAWIEMLDESFGYKGQMNFSYGIDFAPLFEVSSLPFSALFKKNGEIVSSGSLYIQEILTPLGSTKHGLIGAIATKEGHRGKGCSKDILEYLEKLALQFNLDGLLLWGSAQKDFYKNRGFYGVGNQQILSIESLDKSKDKSNAGFSREGWTISEVSSLYEKHLQRVVRSPERWNSVNLIRSCHKWEWVEAGKVTAYLGLDRGMDLNGFVHEWGGEGNALLKLVYDLRMKNPGLQWLTQKNLNDPIRDYLGKKAILCEDDMALFKPLNSRHDWGHYFDQAWLWGLDSM